MPIIEELYKIFCSNPIITTDSRKVPYSSIFFAMKGDSFNGNDFAKDALEKGAAFAVVDKSANCDDDRFIIVDDTLIALQQLARLHRKVLGTKIIAITGTNGKTTTKELCKSILNKKYNVFATFGNLNNHIGVPLSLLTLTKNHDIGIIEMGANHQGEINELCNIAQPDYGLITNIGKAHLEGFGTIEGVAKAKSELFLYLQMKNKTMFVNRNNEYIKSFTPKDYIKSVTYNDEHCNGEVISANPFLQVKVRIAGFNFIVNTSLVGKYNIENVIASVVVGNYFNVPVNFIKEAIEEYTPDNFRSQLIDTGRNKIIMDAYNANPSSILTAIDNFLEMTGENKMLILGQMLELGEVSVYEHLNIINYLEERKIKNVFFIGDAFIEAADKPDYRFYKSVDDLLSTLKQGDILSKLILIKGSRGNRLERLMSVL